MGITDPDFSIEITQEEISNSLVVVDNVPLKFGNYGIDKVEFLLSPNRGEPLKPLAKIASGGELSRIILAFKSILGQGDSIETMIFDEIDSGVGGKIALAVAKQIKKIAMNKQIICITHLPQIASCGDRNFNIYKETIDNKTTSNLKS